MTQKTVDTAELRVDFKEVKEAAALLDHIVSTIKVIKQESRQMMGGSFSDVAIAGGIFSPRGTPAGAVVRKNVYVQALDAQGKAAERNLATAKSTQEHKDAVRAAADARREARNLKAYGTLDENEIHRIRQQRAQDWLNTATARAKVFADTHGGLNRLDWSKHLQGRAEWRANEWDRQHGGRTREEAAQFSLDVAQQRDVISAGRHARRMARTGGRDDVEYERAMEPSRQARADRIFKDRGGSKIQASEERRKLLADQLAERGKTKAEYRAQMEEERKAEHERRRERRQWRVSDRQEAKRARAQEKEEGAGMAALGVLPGAGLLRQVIRQVGKMSPTFAGGAGQMAKTFGSWGSLPVRNPFTAARAGWGATPGLAPSGWQAAGDIFAAGGMGVVGGALVGAGLTYKMAQMAHGAYSNSSQRVANMEQTLRLGAGMGGGVSVKDSFSQMGAKNLASKYGLSPEASAEMYMSFLRSRGGVSSAEGAGDYLDVAAGYGMNAARAGRYAAGGKSAATYAAMAGELRKAGVSGDALDEADAAISDRLHANKRLGLDYSVTRDAGFASHMAASGFGGWQYGGALAMQKMQGLGTGIGDNIRASIGQMADVLSFAEAAKGGGDLMQVVERNRQMSAAENYQALSRGTNADVWAKWGKGFSRQQARGEAAELPGGVGPDAAGFTVPVSSNEAKQAVATVGAASTSQMIRSLQNMDNNIEWFKTRFLTQFSGAVNATGWAAGKLAGTE